MENISSAYSLGQHSKTANSVIVILFYASTNIYIEAIPRFFHNPWKVLLEFVVHRT
jgi:hypothetical protein